MSGWSQQLLRNAGTLRGLAGRLGADPLRPVHGNLDEVWAGPAATELTDGGTVKDRKADFVGDELRRVARTLERRAGQIEAAERTAAASLSSEQAAADAWSPAVESS